MSSAHHQDSVQGRIGLPISTAGEPVPFTLARLRWLARNARQYGYRRQPKMGPSLPNENRAAVVWSWSAAVNRRGWCTFW